MIENENENDNDNDLEQTRIIHNESNMSNNSDDKINYDNKDSNSTIKSNDNSNDQTFFKTNSNNSSLTTLKTQTQTKSRKSSCKRSNNNNNNSKNKKPRMTRKSTQTETYTSTSNKLTLSQNNSLNSTLSQQTRTQTMPRKHSLKLPKVIFFFCLLSLFPFVFSFHLFFSRFGLNFATNFKQKTDFFVCLRFSFHFSTLQSIAHIIWLLRPVSKLVENLTGLMVFLFDWSQFFCN